MEKKVFLVYNTIEPGPRAIVDTEDFLAIYIINPDEEDVGDEVVDLRQTERLGDFIDNNEWNLRTKGLE